MKKIILILIFTMTFFVLFSPLFSQDSIEVGYSYELTMINSRKSEKDIEFKIAHIRSEPKIGSDIVKSLYRDEIEGDIRVDVEKRLNKVGDTKFNWFRVKYKSSINAYGYVHGGYINKSTKQERKYPPQQEQDSSKVNNTSKNNVYIPDNELGQTGIILLGVFSFTLFVLLIIFVNLRKNANKSNNFYICNRCGSVYSSSTKTCPDCKSNYIS